MPARYVFGPATASEARQGAPGAHDRSAHPDYLAVSVRSGRASLDLHMHPAAAMRLAAAILSANGCADALALLNLPRA